MAQEVSKALSLVDSETNKLLWGETPHRLSAHFVYFILTSFSRGKFDGQKTVFGAASHGLLFADDDDDLDTEAWAAAVHIEQEQREGEHFGNRMKLRFFI